MTSVTNHRFISRFPSVSLISTGFPTVTFLQCTDNKESPAIMTGDWRLRCGVVYTAHLSPCPSLLLLNFLVARVTLEITGKSVCSDPHYDVISVSQMFIKSNKTCIFCNVSLYRILRKITTLMFSFQ